MWRGLQGGYPDPPQKIFEQPETPVKKDPHVARLTSGQSRSLHFQMKTLKHVGTEIALHVLAYNMKRVMRILGVGGLMEAIRA
jgi:hypothetical protein